MGGFAYAERADGHRVLILRAALPLDVEQVLPSQFARRATIGNRGPRAPLAAVLASAIDDAGLSRPRPTPPRTSAR